MRPAAVIGSALVMVVLSANAAQAQDAPAPAAASAALEDERREPTRLYVGMWTLHLKHDVVALKNNWLVGVSYRGFFGATFMNSFGRRAYTAGIQRTLAAKTHKSLTTAFGFRLGAISGYDGRFMRLARHTPVLPLISAFVNVDVGRVGVEASYTMVVVSAAVSYRFGK